jgi:hypothetical protein
VLGVMTDTAFQSRWHAESVCGSDELDSDALNHPEGRH